MSMTGIYQIKVDTTTLANGHSIAAYLVDAAGNLLTSTLVGSKQRLDVQSSAEYAEDTAHTTGDYGQHVLAVRNDTEGSLVGTDGDYAPLQVDALGRLRVNADINVNNDFVYAEDSAFTDEDLGAAVLLVRQDTLASSTTADGDYGSFKSTSLGELYVHDTDVLAQLVAANASLDAIEADADEMNTSLNNIEADADEMNTSLNNIEGYINDLRKAEDSVHSSGDYGIQSLAVRNDAGTALAADGDYIPFTTDSSGRLRVTANIGGQFAEDSAASSGDIGNFSLAVRRDAQGTQTSADGDYSEFQTWSEGSLKVVDIANEAILQQQVSVTSTAAQVPTANLANRKTLMLQNTGGAKMWIGSATVTTAGATAGIELPANSFIELEAGPDVDVYAVKSGAGSLTLNVLEMA